MGDFVARDGGTVKLGQRARARSRLRQQLVVAVAIDCNVHTYCLTVPACGRTTSVLSTRYTRRTSAIVAVHRSNRRQFSRSFESRFDSRAFPNVLFLVFFFFFFFLNSITISTMHAIACLQAFLRSEPSSSLIQMQRIRN